MVFTVENFEYILLIIARVSAFLYTAPFFNMNTIPVKVKAAASVLIGLLIYNAVPFTGLEYESVIDFAGLVIKEVVAGLILGYLSNIVMTILGFAGKIVDMEIGLSMVTELDPLTRTESSITGNIYTYLLMLVLLATNFHHFLIKAFVDTYQVIPVGRVELHAGIYTIMMQFMTQYFIIAFRIVLPIYATILLVNVVLAILAKVSPQMNMFVIGLQLKIFAGLLILMLVIVLLPAVSDFLTGEMIDLFKLAVINLKP